MLGNDVHIVCADGGKRCSLWFHLYLGTSAERENDFSWVESQVPSIVPRALLWFAWVALLSAVQLFLFEDYFALTDNKDLLAVSQACSWVRVVCAQGCQTSDTPAATSFVNSSAEDRDMWDYCFHQFLYFLLPCVLPCCPAQQEHAWSSSSGAGESQGAQYVSITHKRSAKMWAVDHSVVVHGPFPG